LLAEIFGSSNVGLIRHDNQDSFMIANLETGDIATMIAPALVSVHTAPFILIVADGVGGAASGALASSIATETILSELHRWWHKVPKRTPESIEAALKRGIDVANRAIYQKATTSPEHHGMGTTTTLALVLDGEAFIAQVGDSRAYSIYTDGRIEPITRDHSLVKRLEELGHLSKDEAENFPHRNVLIRALGQGETLEADIFTVPFPQTGYLMICSDGLWGVINEKDILRSITEAPNLHRACQNLVDAANAAGGPDNISVILAQLIG